ncbi:MAG: hypothetical protein JWR80_6144 [Bradyrhizobium sp.]|nr:hypothetical protein [Bradyrhizobium sp.]
MNKMIDPRSLGFNYGSSWGTQPKPPVYHAAVKVAFTLQRQAREISDKAWRLEMVIRNVRLAGTAAERTQAVARLEKALADYLPRALDDA